MSPHFPPSATARHPVLRALITLLTVITLGLATAGCETSIEEETRLFELAEERLRVGDYEGARHLYSRFIDEHPQSTLRLFAERRLVTLNREFDAVMGRRGAPAPVHVPPPGSEHFRPEAPPPTPRIDAPRLPSLED